MRLSLYRHYQCYIPSPSNHPEYLLTVFMGNMISGGMLITLPINSCSSVLTRLLSLRDQLVSNCDLLENRRGRARDAGTAPTARARARAPIRALESSGLWQRPQLPGAVSSAASPHPTPRRAETRVDDSFPGGQNGRWALATGHGPAISTPLLFSPLLLVLHRRYK